jgi:plasmid rolling circle replication initiator protein Rep
VAKKSRRAEKTLLDTIQTSRHSKEVICTNYTNEFIKEMAVRQENNVVYSKYYYRISTNFEGNLKEILEKKSNRIKDCLNLWQWDKYEKNKVLDLIKVNRCMDKFCTNCRTFGIAKVIHNFRPKFELMLSKGYKPFLMTLTIPNVPGEDLEITINKMNKSFSTFFKWFNKDIGKGQSGFSKRFVHMKACIKVLEINVQATDHRMYHPHFHVMVFLDEEEVYEMNNEFEKYIPGAYSKKRKCVSLYSAMDVHIQQLWHMAYNNIPLSQYSTYTDLWYELYQADIRPMVDEYGIYEVFKYTFKDKDIYNIKNFDDLYFALENKRLRQGYGELFNLKLEEETGDKQELELEIKETPQQLLTKELNTLITVYADYRKISRFSAHKDLDKIK